MSDQSKDPKSDPRDIPSNPKGKVFDVNDDAPDMIPKDETPPKGKVFKVNGTAKD